MLRRTDVFNNRRVTKTADLLVGDPKTTKGNRKHA